MFTHNMAKNFHIIFNFFPHPIRSPVSGYGGIGDYPKEIGELPQLHGIQYTCGAITKDHTSGYCKNSKKGAGTMRVVKKGKKKVVKLWVTLDNWLMLGTH